MSDFQARREEVLEENAAEKGDDVLRMDWTKKAATRCSAEYMFNVMSGSRRIVASIPASSAGPHEMEDLLWQMRGRGVNPKVAYVDDECCGAWAEIVSRVWPGATVRLDAMHALARLTRTTTSTQHPWQGQFCSMLSDALFTYDPRVMHRLQTAWARSGAKGALPKNIKTKLVPRIVQDASRVSACIDGVINTFLGKTHPEGGTLLTPDTNIAWKSLREHVCRGCLCDPPNVNVHVYDERENISIGGETFYRVRTCRGTSPLEGFHCHQKQWLGTFGIHTQEAGMALVADGTLRWNRQRANEASSGSDKVPLVFAGSVLQEIQRLHQEMTGESLYPNLHIDRRG